jgi:monoamine oxidase
MSRADFDVVVVGAGVAGLTVLRELDRAGLRVLCIEARDRIGGRIHTIHPTGLPIPIELGAEFVHGRPPETWKILREADLAVYDVEDSSATVERGTVVHQPGEWEPVDAVMEDLCHAASNGADRSFADFIEASNHSAEAKAATTSFVEGFNAARKEIVGIASLAKDRRAAERIDGDRSFRVLRGYDAVPEFIAKQIPDRASKIRLHTALKAVKWDRNGVSISTSSIYGSGGNTISARRLVVTVPLGVLQAEESDPAAIAWDPVPRETLDAARSLAFGKVIRVVCRFSEPIWESERGLGDAGFIFVDEPSFPTWWSALPLRAPILTGWSAGPKTDQLTGRPREEVIREAVRALSKMLSVSVEQVDSKLQRVYWHDWDNDPFARGAYSYVPVGAMPARTLLAAPVSDTLYFSGEATELDGHSATVHGAIAAGLRTAQQIILHTKG